MTCFQILIFFKYKEYCLISFASARLLTKYNDFSSAFIVFIW